MKSSEGIPLEEDSLLGFAKVFQVWIIPLALRLTSASGPPATGITKSSVVKFIATQKVAPGHTTARMIAFDAQLPAEYGDPYTRPDLPERCSRPYH